MCVGTTGTERADARPAGSARCRKPRLGLLGHDERAVREVDVRIRFAGVQGGHDRAVHKLKQHLGESGNARCTLGVADVRLDRANGAAVMGRPTAAEDPARPVYLDRVAQRCAGSVCLHIGHRCRIPSGLRNRPLDERCLRRRARHGHATGTTAVVDRGRADHAVDVVTVGQRPGERLEQHRADAFAGDVPGAVPAEGPAAPVAGQPLALGELQVLLRMHGDVHPAGQRQVALAATQALHGEMDRRERGRARGVDRHARPGEVECVRHAVGHGGVHSGRRDAVLRAGHELVVVPHHPGEDAHGRTAQ